MAFLAASGILVDSGRGVTRPTLHDDPVNTRAMVGESALPGAFTQVLTPAVSSNMAGVVASGYASGIVYGNMWVSPAAIVRSFLISEETVPIKVWNADRTASRTLTVTGGGDDGLSLSMDSPQTIDADGEASGVLTLEGSGPAEQDSEIAFVAGSLSVIMGIEFQRAIPFPIRHNWREGYKFALEYETAISTSRDRNEQRQPLTGAPTRAISMTATARGVLAQRIRNLITKGAARVFAVPLHHEEFTVTSVDETGCIWSVSGAAFGQLWNLNRLPGNLIFSRSDGTGFVRELSAVDADAGTLITTSAGPDGIDVSGMTVAPAMLAVLSKASPTAITGDVEEWDITWAEFAGPEQPELFSLPEMFERLDTTPNWATHPKTGLALDRTFIAYSGGAHAIYELYDRQTASLEYSVTEHRQGLFSLLDQFCAARGRWKGFWHTGNERAFTLTRDHLSTESILDVADNAFALTRPGSERIRLYPEDGDPFTVVIDSITTTADGLRLNLASTLGVDCLQPTPVVREYRARFDVDTLTVTYPVAGYGNADLRVAELIQEYE